MFVTPPPTKLLLVQTSHKKIEKINPSLNPSSLHPPLLSYSQRKHHTKNFKKRTLAWVRVHCTPPPPPLRGLSYFRRKHHTTLHQTIFNIARCKHHKKKTKKKTKFRFIALPFPSNWKAKQKTQITRSQEDGSKKTNNGKKRKHIWLLGMVSRTFELSSSSLSSYIHNSTKRKK